MVAQAKPLTRTELSVMYGDAEWREKLLDVMALVGILRDCIIESQYRPSEELKNAIALTDVGVQVRQRMITQEKVDANDAKLLALLGLVHVDPLVDIDAIDPDALASAISAEMRSGAIRFPLILGRELYERCVTLFAEERDYLNHEDTLKLLEGIDQGVFQAGPFLLGPYGVRRRPFYRRMGPTTAVPIQHCADNACARVHRVQLTTSIEAGVNRSRPSLGKVLDQISNEPSEWNGFISDITEDRFNEYEVRESAGVEYVLGDAFSDDELRSLALHAASTTNGALQANATELGIEGQPRSVVPGMSRAQLLQLLLMFDNDTLGSLIDSAIREGELVVPADEVRRPRVNRAAHFGAWGLRPQISRLGVRALSEDPDLPLLRMSALVRDLFDVDSANDMEELSWILRGTRGATADEQLAEFLRTSEPAHVIDTLVLARRQNARAVCAMLGIDIEQENAGLRDSVLWKLGFPLPRSQDLRDEYWRLHGSLEALAKTAAVDLTSTAEGLRQASSDYFVSLERFLFDSLVFATWGLLQDHYLSKSPFTFFEADARSFSIAALNDPDEDVDLNRLTDEPVLSAIVLGFVRLAKKLDGLRGDADAHLRESGAFPKYAAKTALQRFPFAHVHPYLDLLPDAQVHLAETLAKVGNELNNSGIMTARNGLLHAKQRVPLVGEVEEALQRARVALNRLESIGCVRSTFAVSSTVTNAWGGSTTTLSSNGRTISFSSPSPYEWAKLPSFGRPHYLMQGAVFARPNEMLRFSEGFDSEYQRYWANFPVRPEPGNRIVSSQSESLATTSETGSYSAPRVG
ncbi:hypothetical protein [Microbacterium paulum]